MSKIKLFLDDCTTRYEAFYLSLRAGYIDEDGIVCDAQMGAKDTFSVGMPVYDDDGVELGRLSIGLWKNLNWSQEKIDIEIPVHHWRVEGYKGKQQSIKTYHQLKQQQTRGGSDE